MPELLATLLLAGLLCSSRFYGEQIASLWQLGPAMIADHTRDDSMSAIARRILASAPPTFALVGHSMGGCIAFEIMRQAAAARRVIVPDCGHMCALEQPGAVTDALIEWLRS